MKTRLKYLIGLLVIAVSFSITSVALGTNKVKASAGAVLTQTYEVYEKSDWDIYYNKKTVFDTYWNSTVSVDTMEGVIFSLSGNNTKKNQAKTAIRGITWTNGYFNPKDIMDLGNANVSVNWPVTSDYTDLHSYWDWSCDPADRMMATDAEGNEATVAPYVLFGGYIEDFFDSEGQFIPFNKPAKVENATTGATLVVAVYISSNEGVYGYQVGPSLGKFATNISVSNYYPSNWNPANYPTYTVDGTGTHSGKQFVIFGGSDGSTSHTYIQTFDNYLAGVVQFNVAGSASGECVIDKPIYSIAKWDQKTQFSSIGHLPDASGNIGNFAWNTTSFEVGSGLKNTTDIKNIAVTEQPSGAAKSATASSVTGVDYAVADDFTPSATFNMSYTVSDNGKVTWIEKSNDGSTWTDLSSSTGSSSSPVDLTGNQNLNGIGLPAEGQALYLKFHITAENGTTTGEKVVRLCTSPKLSGLSIKTNTGSAEEELVGHTTRFYQTANASVHTFSPDVENYTIEIPYNSASAKTVKFAATYLAGQTAKADSKNLSNSLTTYTDVTIPSGTSSASVEKKIEVTGVNGTSKKIYTITIKLLNDKQTIDNLAVSYTKGSSSGTHNTTPSTTSGVDFEYTLDYSEELNGIIPTSADIESIKVGLTKASLTDVTSGATFSINSANAPAAGTYKDYYISVKSKAGNTTEYVLRVKRDAASTDAKLSNLSFKTVGGTNLTYTKDGSTLADSTEFTISTDLAAKETSFIFVPTFNSKAAATMTVGGAAVTNAGNNTYSIGAVSLSPVSDSFQFTITPESGAGDAKTYTVKFTRKAANDDHTLNVEIYNGTIALAKGGTGTTTTAPQFTYTTLNTSQTLTMPGGYNDSGTGYLKYDVTSVDVKAVFDTTKGIEVKNSTGSTINNNAVIQTINFGTPSTVTTDNTKKITFIVKSEYDVLTGGAGETYELTVTRDDINDDYKYFEITYYYVDANGTAVYDGSGTTQFAMINNTAGDTYNAQTTTAKKMPFNIKEIHYTINRPASGVIPLTTDIKVSGVSIIGAEQTIVVASLTDPYVTTIPVSLSIQTQKQAHPVTLNFQRKDGQTGVGVTINARGVTTNDPISGSDVGTTGRKFVVDPTSDTKIKLAITPVTNLTDLTNSDRAKIYVTDNTSNPKKYEYGVDPDMEISVPANIAPDSTRVYVYVYPEASATPQQYIVDVYRKDNRSTKNGITNIEFIDADGNVLDVLKDGSTDYFVYNQATLAYTLRVPYSVTSLKFKVTTEDSKATIIQPAIGVSDDASNKAIHTFDKALTSTGTTPNTVKVQAQAENGTGSPKVYEFKIYRDNPRTGNLITSLKINGIDLPNADAYFTAKKSYSTNVLADGRPLTSIPVEFTVSDGAEWTATDFFTSTAKANVTVTNGKASFKITVTSEAGVSVPYTFDLFSAYEDYSLSNIELFKNSSKDALEFDASTSFVYNYNTKDYTVRVPYANPTATVIATIGATAYKNQAIYIDGTKLSAIDISTGDLVASKDYSTIAINPLTTEVKVLVKSQYAELNPTVTNQQKEFKIVISRTPADTDSTLKSLVVTVGDKTFDLPFSPSVTTGYKIEQVTGANATFSAEPNSSKAKVTFKTFSGTAGETISGTVPLGLSETTSRETFSFVVYPEDGPSTTYEVVISKDKITLDTVNTISDISVFANGNASENLMVNDNTYLDTKYEYNITIPGVETGVKIQATPTQNTAVITYDGVAASNKNTSSKSYMIAEGDTLEVVIGCNAENGDANPNTYKIKITREVRDTNNNLEKLTVDSNELTAPYKIHLPNGTTSTTIGATAESEKATVSGDIGTVNLTGYENQFTVTIKAEDGTPKNITVTVYVDEPVTLSNLSVKDLITSTEHVSGFEPNKIKYEISFDFDMDSAEIAFVPTGNFANGLTATLDGDPFPSTKKLTKNVEVGLNTFELEVKSETDSKTYTIEITRSTGSGDNFILEYIKAGTIRNELGVMPKAEDWNPMENTYKYVVDRNVSEVFFNALTDAQVEAGESIETITTGNITMKISPNARIKAVLPTNTQLNLGTNVFTIDIESQTNHINTYTITIVRADIACEITNIELLTSASSGANTLDVDGNSFVYDSQTKTYEFTVPYSTERTFLKVTKSSTAKAYLDTGAGYAVFANSLQDIAEGVQTFKIKAKAEVESYLATDTYVSDEYLIKITRSLPGTDPSLEELHAVVTKTNGEKVDLLIDKFDPETKAYVIENLDNLVEPNIASIDIKAVAKLATTKVENVLSTYEKTEALPAFSGEGVSQTGYVFKFNIKTVAESGAKDEYNINICRGPLDLKDTKDVLAVVVTDSNGTKYLGNDNTYNEKFDKETLTYSYTIPYPTQSFTIDILKGSTYDTSTKNGTGQFTIPTDLALGAEKSYVVFLTSEKGNNSDKYTVNIKVEAPSADARLEDFILGGKSGKVLFNFDPETETYVYPSKIPYDEPLITIEGIPVDPKATVNPAIETEKTLAPGSNTLSITVTAQDGKTQKTYSLIINRDYPDAFLNDIAVSNYQLYSSNVFEEANEIEEFSKEIKDIYVVVPNEISNAPISIEVPDKTYQTTCTNSKESHAAGSPVNRQFTDLQFAEGMNNFTIEATSGQGKKVQYNVHVNRLGKQSTVTTVAGISVIPRSINNRNATSTVNDYLDDTGLDSTKEDDNVSLFNADLFNNGVIFDYKVPNKVTSLSINVDPIVSSVSGSGLKQEVEILGNDKLYVGKNQVVIIIKSADGLNSRAVVLNVIREEMEYEVKADSEQLPISDPKVTRTPEDGTKLTTVEINLGNIELKDDEKSKNLFLDYIKYDENNNNITTEVLSDLTNPKLKQVLVKVTDGDISDLVAFTLKKTGLDYEVKADTTQVKITEESIVNYPTDGSKNTTVRIGLKAIEEQLKTKISDKENLANARKLFTDYIKVAEGVDDITCEVVSDLTDPNLTEVLVRVTNGEQTDLVTFKLDNVSLSADSVLDLIKTWWPLFIGILAAIILLILILISVNRDKYGKINKNRKHAD